MENGDLTVVDRPTIIVVLEGVLCGVTVDEDNVRLGAGLLRRLGARRAHKAEPNTPLPGYYKHEITWWDVPLKRLATMTRRFDVDIDVVTFVSQELADDAADFFNDIGLHIASVRYQDFNRWVQTLPYMVVQMVVDSDQKRLDRYGQLGRSVTRGEDW